MKVSDAIAYLEQMPCDESIAFAIWTIADIHVMERGLNNEEAEMVIEYVHDYQDAINGINWDTMAEGIEFYANQ